MMTLTSLMSLLATLETAEDVTLMEYRDGTTSVTIEDFDGFDEDWCEVEREFTCPELVEELESFIQEYGEGSFYYTVELEGRRFQFGYSSYDI